MKEILGVGGVIVICVLAVTSCNMYETYKLAELIEKGADPIAARCAYSMNPSATQCVLKAANK